jgi:hypothetical protein
MHKDIHNKIIEDNEIAEGTRDKGVAHLVLQVLQVHQVPIELIYFTCKLKNKF